MSDPVQLMLEGQYENPDVPVQVINNRTFVPVRYISERMGAFVYWDEQERKIQISRGASTVYLFIDQQQIYQNGQAYEMDVAPFIKDGRTMVPIRFVSEYLGLRVGWEGTERLVIISNPVDLVLNGNMVGGKYQPINVHGDLYVPIFYLAQLTNVSVAFEEDEQVYSFTDDEQQKSDQSYDMSDDKQASVTEEEEQHGEAVESEREDADEQQLEDEHLEEEYLEDKQHDEQQAETVENEVHTENDPLQNSAVKFLPASEIITIDEVRMVKWEWAEKLLGAEVTYDASTSRIILRKEIQSTELTNVDYRNGSYILSFSGPVDGDVNHFFLQDPLRIVVDISNVKLSQMLKPTYDASITLPLSHGTVNQLRLSQFSVSPLTVRVVFDLNQRSTVHVDVRNQEIILQVEEKRPLVVIDPGHGGRDPGALGQMSQEKQIVLNVANQLIQLLRDDPDIDVVPTRESDVYLSLDERVNVANQAQADLFLSVHTNAATSSSAVGSETYVYKNIDQSFGQVVHNHLIQATQLPDRGLKEARFRVLRLTNMPAALIEIAFISNPNEEALLNDPIFQDRVAHSMYNAIREYLYGK